MKGSENKLDGRVDGKGSKLLPVVAAILEVLD